MTKFYLVLAKITVGSLARKSFAVAVALAASIAPAFAGIYCHLATDSSGKETVIVVNTDTGKVSEQSVGAVRVTGACPEGIIGKRDPLALTQSAAGADT